MNEVFHVKLMTYLEKCKTMTRAEFLAEYPHAVLLLEKVSGDAGTAGFLTTAARPEEMGEQGTKFPAHGPVPADERPSGRQDADVLPLERSKSATGSGMITLGRSAQNDLRVNSPSVSKLHAYFTCSARGGGWHVADAGSSNGTYLNGEKLEVRKRLPLVSGAALRFSPDVVAHFFEAEDFFQFLRAFERRG